MTPHGRQLRLEPRKGNEVGVDARQDRTDGGVFHKLHQRGVIVVGGGARETVRARVLTHCWGQTVHVRYVQLATVGIKCSAQQMCQARPTACGQEKYVQWPCPKLPQEMNRSKAPSDLWRRARAKSAIALRKGVLRGRLAAGVGPARPLADEATVDDLRSICCLWGPYRNLTTITAAAIGVHPGVKVLNHGGEFVLADSRLDFLRAASPDANSRFLQFALDHQTDGVRGDRGGSIELSHAFDDPALRRAYAERPASAAVGCVVWKESQAVTNHIRSAGLTTGDVVRINPLVRFVLPVRNPVACAASNIRTGHAGRFPGVDRNSFDEVVDRVVEQIFIFAAAADDCENHLLFFEDDEPASIARGLVDVCGLTSSTPADVSAVASLLAFRPAAAPSPRQRRAFHAALVRHRGSDQDAVAERLVALVDAT